MNRERDLKCTIRQRTEKENVSVALFYLSLLSFHLRRLYYPLRAIIISAISI